MKKPKNLWKMLRKEEVKRRIPWKTIVINKVSATISCNCGAEAFGGLFLTR